MPVRIKNDKQFAALLQSLSSSAQQELLKSAKANGLDVSAWEPADVYAAHLNLSIPVAPSLLSPRQLHERMLFGRTFTAEDIARMTPWVREPNGQTPLTPTSTVTPDSPAPTKSVSAAIIALIAMALQAFASAFVLMMLKRAAHGGRRGSRRRRF